MEHCVQIRFSGVIMAFYLILLGIGIPALLACLRFALACWKYRGDRVITCPENRRPAGVRLDARHAAATELLNSTQLRLSTCTRWPEKAGCAQGCVPQIQESPDGCLVRLILARWYHGKSCAVCGREFGEIDWAGAKPGLFTPEGISLESREISADRISEVLESALPLCFACHMANRLVHEHADLAIDRGRPALQIQAKRSGLRETVDS
jgi:hypothetical protein